ncbi:cell division protein FtsQ/DivIB [Sphingosinicella sp. CPCC 101087]|uniref:cell division protein FtsQ/DivIB n=1 Tax=Sphingosinicella sp. CPCC 101087 TaxID=2497754 RepID=UPI00101CA555|nr:FtsQ-type POTRA domain-containing protein [Sphingosinicella sp. CPCC 101087]
MSARIAKGGAGRGNNRARAKPRPSGRSVNTRRAKSESLLDSFGFSPGTGRRIGGWAFAALAVIAAIAAILAFRLPQMASTALAESIGEAGFALRHVEIKGNVRVSRLDVLNVAFDQSSMAMPLVDIEATRDRLLQFGWVREARVHRRLPDTLVIDIVEREPAAIWQNNRELSLVDAEGVVLEPVRLEAMPELLLVIGDDANHHLATLRALLGEAPHLRPQVTGATWVSGRRWDVRFQTGEVLALPEGDEAARRAIRNFARMDQQTQLLGRGFVRFDMRIPGRFIVRVSREPGTSVPELAPPQPATPSQGLTRTI